MATPRTTIKGLVKATPQAVAGQTSRSTRSSASRPPPSAGRSAGRSSAPRSWPQPQGGAASATRGAPSSGKARAKAKGGDDARDGDTPRTLIRKLAHGGAPAAGKSSSRRSARKAPAAAAAAAAAAAGAAEQTPRTLLRNVIINAASTPSAAGSPFVMPTPSMPTPQSLNASVALSTPGSLPSGGRQGTRPFLLASRSAADKAAAAAAAMPPPSAVPRKGKGKASSCPLPSSLVNGLLASFTPLPFAPGAKAAAHEALTSFFAQAAGDLESYAGHSGRQTVEPADVALLLKRQRQTTGEPGTPTAVDLARKHLPMEMITEILPVAISDNRVTPAPKLRRKRSKKAAGGSK